MGKSNTQQTSFTAGEVSPLIRGRPDVAKYGAGAETCENFIVRPQGPLWRRGGTKHVRRMARWGFGTNCIYPFEFSSSESYLIEFSDGYILISDREGLPITTGSAIAIASVADSAGTPEVTTTGAHGLATDDHVYITSSTVAGYAGLWQIESTAANKFKLLTAIYSATATAVATKCVHLVSPYALSHACELSFAQSADTLFICHKNYKPRKLTRSSATSWAIAEFTTVDGPYLDYDTTNVRMRVSSILDAATMTGNAAFAADRPFVAGDVNDYIEYFDDGEWYLALITAITSTSVATVNIVDRVLVALHPATSLIAKGSDGSRPPGQRNPLVPPVSQGPGYTHPFARGRIHRPARATAGVSPNDSPTPVQREALDASTALTVAGGVLTASHSGTFAISDVGKVVRTGPLVWYEITGFTNNYTVTVGTSISVASGTMKNYSYPGHEVRLDQNSRVITATLTASSATFASTDVGRHIRLNFQGRWVFAKISAYTSTTVVTIRMYESFPRNLRDASRLANDGITDIWQFGAWYGSDGTGNYPGRVTFHEQRLVFAASPAQPQTLWFSRPQDFNKMSPSEPDGQVLDDNAINVTIASNKINGITWLASAKVLLVGTIGGEWQGRAATSITEPITPTNIAFTEETTHGAIDNFQPVKVGSAVLFLQRSGQKALELTYNFELDGWSSRDLTVASEHILRKATKGVKMVYQNEPHGIVWVQTSSGDLVGMTYKREQEVTGWHYHRIGGSGIVEGMAVLPSSGGTEDTVFLVVKRTINGETRHDLERLSSDDYPDSVSDKSGFFYVDAFATQTQSGTGTTWSAFGHLIGSTVTVLKNGVSQGTFVVNASGSVTGLSYVNGDVLTGGLAFTSKFKNLPLQGGSPYGSSDMTTKRVHKLLLRVYNSINCKVGRDENNLVTKTFSGTAGAESLKTGDVELSMNTEYGSDGVFHLQVTDPYPLILLSTVAQLVNNE